MVEKGVGNKTKQTKKSKRKCNYDHGRSVKDKHVIGYIRSEVIATNSNPVIIDLVDEKKVSVIGDKSQKIISTMQQKDKKVDKNVDLEKEVMEVVACHDMISIIKEKVAALEEVKERLEGRLSNGNKDTNEILQLKMNLEND